MVSFREPMKLLSTLLPYLSFPARWTILCPRTLRVLMSFLEECNVSPPFRISSILGIKMKGLVYHVGNCFTTTLTLAKHLFSLAKHFLIVYDLGRPEMQDLHPLSECWNYRHISPYLQDVFLVTVPSVIEYKKQLPSIYIVFAISHP